MSLIKPISLLLTFTIALGTPLCKAAETETIMKNKTAINEQPNLIPAPQEWIGATGHFDITTATLTTPHGQLSQLKPVLDLFSRNLWSIDAVTSTPKIGKSTQEISFEIMPAQGEVSPEQYSITIEPNRITASASTPSGIFYASQSLLQLAMNSPKLPCGTITDYPNYRIRSLMLDVGRKFFPYETLKDYIRTMGFLKLNELHLHISDNSFGDEIYPGFRIECETMPELTNKDGFYTKTQIRELQDFASMRGITITPEIDAPGHAFCFTRLRPDLKHPKLGDAYLDVTNPETVTLMKSIFDEFIPLFDGSDVHIGTDEYRRGSASKEEWEILGEGFRQYINIMGRYIKEKHGKNVRIWSGWEHMPGTTQPDTDIIIDMWVSSDAKDKSALGYKYINSNHGRTYIVPGAGYYGVSNSGLYNNWTPAVFTGKADKDPSPDDPNLLGGKLHVWNDMGPNGYSMYEIAQLTVPTLYVMSEKMWGTKASENYDAFKTRVEELNNIPNTRLTERIVLAADKETSLVFDSGETIYTLETSQSSIPLMPYIGSASDDRKNLEYPWTLSMEIKPAENTSQTAPASFISSRIAELQADLQYTTKKKNKKTKVETKTHYKGLGFSRLDKYSSSPLRGPTSKSSRNASGILLPEGEFSTLTYVGKERSTLIYINGKQIAAFNGSKSQSICPLEYVGAYPGRDGGFVGQIKNLKIYNKSIDKHEIAKLAGFEIPVNIAAGCKVVASHSDTAYNLVPENLTDNNSADRNSRWSSGSTEDPAQVTLDLGETRTIDAINLHWETAHPETYTVETSSDGINYKVMTNAKGKQGLVELKTDKTETRYIRINMQSPATQWGYSLYEIEVFGK